MSSIPFGGILQPTGASAASGQLLPQLTFAIPYYSGYDYLEKAIASVFRQNMDCWDLIVCDDNGAEPEVEKLVNSFQDSRVRYYKNKRRLGMAANWNRCLELARTDLVTLLHGDDEVLECYGKVMTTTAAQYPHAAAFFCSAIIIDEKGVEHFSFPDFFKRLLIPAANGALILRGEQALCMVLRGNFIMCPTLCYRKSVIGPRRFSDRWKMVQDLRFTTQLLLDGETLIGRPQFGYAYRRHSQNATIQYTESLQRFHEEVQLYNILSVETGPLQWKYAARLARQKSIIKLHLAYCVFQDLSRLRFRRASEKAAYLLRLLVEATGTRTELSVAELGKHQGGEEGAGTFSGRGRGADTPQE